jgi:hypothetical protein
MNRVFTSRLLLLALVLAGGVQAQSKVAVEKTNAGFRLVRNGKPYAIKGVGFGNNSDLDTLVAAGGNSIRTWSPDKVDTLLDDAHQRGLTVCVGFWLGHPRHGFDYLNEAAVLKQLDDIIAAVKKYKDHPAVLMWGVGNEMEGERGNPSIWYAVNHIAREIKKVDANHPTMTVIAELGADECKVHSIDRFCPDIDIIGLNSYGGIPTLAERFNKAGVSKPYIVTEHGPPGPWETAKTAWKAPVELTSTQKAKAFADGYRSAVANQPGLCFGSYAFLWGHKQETTATWFGMVLPDGTRLAAVDAMSEAWTGKPPKNRCPRIESLKLDRVRGIKPGDTLNATLVANDPESDKLNIKWVLRSDKAVIGAGGDAQEDEQEFASAVTGNGMNAKVTVPSTKGGYRLFAYVRDGQGGGATANVPLYVDGGKMAKSTAPKGKLPFVVYGDGSNQTVYAASGFMGNAGAIGMKLDATDKPHSGKTCLEVKYNSTKEWGGVLWQSPANDWDGAEPGGANLTGATSLEFWARGDAGGEVVNFVMGVLDGAQAYPDTAKAELPNVKLSKEWQKFTMPLNGRDLSRIKTGFGWSLAAQGNPVKFYLDDIRYVK